MLKISRPSDDYRKIAGIGIAVVVGTFGVLGVWAAVAPLSSAVIGHGVTAVDSNRQTVQHYEGGIVRKILVREGDHVNAGQVLFELDPVQAEASLDIAKNQLFSLQTKLDRLSAERDNRGAVSFSPEVRQQAKDPVVAQAMVDQERQFHERRASIEGQVSVLNNRIEQYKTEIGGMELEVEGMKTQVGYLKEEISGLSDLYKQDLVPKPRLLAVQRSLAQLEGQIGRSIADKAKAGQAIGETQLQIRSIRQQFYQDVSKDIVDTQTQLSDIRQKYVVALDQSKRISVRAPSSGTIQSLRVFTNGAVVRPGEPLVEIGPDHGQMVVQAHFSPADIDSVHPGQEVQMRFSSFHSRTIPVITAKIHSISQDRLADEATHQPYYLAVVQVTEAQLPPELKGRLLAGMPVDVIAQTGSRTALNYMFSPLFEAFQKSMRER